MGGLVRRHLTDAELVDGAARGLSGDGEVHLVQCAACRADVHRLRAAVAALAGDVHKQAARPAAMWNRRRVRIMNRVGQAPRAPGGRKGWGWARLPAAAVVAALLVGLVWSSGRWSTIGEPETDPPRLLAVQDATGADALSALRPVALLVNEMERASAGTRHERDIERRDIEK